MKGSGLLTRSNGGRTRDDAIATSRTIEPVWLNRLMIVDEQLGDTLLTAEAQSRRRDEAAYELASAGVSYADIARILEVTPERVRQLVARHLDITVYDLNPKTTTAPSRH